uniref:Serpin domain-containing protein n=1 Tax=Stomoxys calcitrans TaxID=35570 RepID=A0A1I8PTU2_STOCA
MELKPKIWHIAGMLAILSCTASPTPVIDGQKFSQSLDYFSNNMWSEIYETKGQSSIIYSPFSIQTCLTMGRLGADGETAREMDQQLGFTSQTRENLAENFHSILAKYENSNILKIANKVYVMKGYELQDNYNRLLTDKFFSAAENVDFADSAKASNTINSWVETKTGNTIKNLIKPGTLSSDTRLFLLSAIYFKGAWKNPFDPKHTEEEEFFVNAVESKKVPMMFKMGTGDYGRLAGLQASAVRLHYADSDLSMMVILPNERYGLNGLMENLKAYPLESLARNVTYTSRAIDIFLPKFKVELDVNLKEILQKMGMNKMFSSNADFSKMLKSSTPLTVGSVMHKAYIEVNEEGTVAGAATGMAPMAMAGPIVFKANHPFYYIIMTSDFVPLFEGTYIGV